MIERSVHESMYRMAWGAVAVLGAFIIINAALGITKDPRQALAVLMNLPPTGWAVAVVLMQRRRQRALAVTEAFGFVLVSLVTANVLGAAWLFTDARELFYLAFLPVGLGVVAVRRQPWRAVAGLIWAVTGCMAGAIGARTGDDRAIVGVVMMMTASVIVAAAIQAGRRRSYATIFELHQAARDRHAELAAALLALEGQLADRQRSEVARIALEARERELADQLRHVQKLDAVGTLAGGISHDINNVLAAILGVAELGVEDHGGAAVAEEFAQIVTAAQRGAALTRNLLGFARRGKHRHEPVTLRSIIDEVLTLLARTAPQRIRFVRDHEPGAAAAVVMGDPAQLSHVVMNLCLNAIDAIADTGTITLALSAATLASGERAMLAPGPYLRFEVRDTGAGMTPETLEHAFEPFYSTKTSTLQRGGSGLGLAMVYGTIRDHQGEVSLRSEPGAGTTATILLPTVAVQPVLARPLGMQSSRPTLPALTALRPVLVIDDEEMVRKVCTRLLGTEAVASQAAESGHAALALFQADPTTYSMALLDLAMPGMTGAECFRALRAIDPEFPIVLMSGFPKDQSLEELLALGRAAFLPKPFVRSALLEALARCRP